MVLLILKQFKWSWLLNHHLHKHILINNHILIRHQRYMSIHHLRLLALLKLQHQMYKPIIPMESLFLKLLVDKQFIIIHNANLHPWGNPWMWSSNVWSITIWWYIQRKYHLMSPNPSPIGIRKMNTVLITMSRVTRQTNAWNSNI